MKTALLINPAKEGEHLVSARTLTEQDVDRYKRLGLVFGCKACPPKTFPDGDIGLRPEMEWRSGYYGTGGKWFNACFSAVAGTTDQHTSRCPVQENRRESPRFGRIQTRKALESGYPSVGYLNVRTHGHPPYSIIPNKTLDEQYDGLRLTRSAPPMEEKKELVQNRILPFSIRSMKDFLKWATVITETQGGSLSKALISHGGGVRSLPGSFFVASDMERRGRLYREGLRGWQALGLLQSATQNPKNAQTQFALHPLLMEILPSARQNWYQAPENTRKKTDPDRNLLSLRGSGGSAGNYCALTTDIICPDYQTRQKIEETFSKHIPVFAFVTPIVHRTPDQKNPPQTLNLRFHVMNPDLIHFGPLPTTIAYALKDTYRRNDWARGIMTAAAPT